MSKSWMVADRTEPVGLDPRPFGKFGPFDTEDDANAFINAMANPQSYFTIPSKECK